MIFMNLSYFEFGVHATDAFVPLLRVVKKIGNLTFM